MGMDWTLREGYSWAEDKEHCEEYGRMLQADPTKVSFRAKKRGLPQVRETLPQLLSTTYQLFSWERWELVTTMVKSKLWTRYSIA